MSLLVVDRGEQLEHLKLIADMVSKASVSEADKKKEYEKTVNKFLDFILEQKQFYREHTAETKAVIAKIEGLSWFSAQEEDVLLAMQRLIESMHGLYNSMRDRYISANVFFTRQKVGMPELSEYKGVADDIKELASDLHTRFFTLPQDDEFQALTKTLESL